MDSVAKKDRGTTYQDKHQRSAKREVDRKGVVEARKPLLGYCCKKVTLVTGKTMRPIANVGAKPFASELVGLEVVRVGLLKSGNVRPCHQSVHDLFTPKARRGL
jgi:hypothetical protein